ncbi:MAG TPA: DnaJ domain-containing protein [Polyangiaceae bacterium]|nr:DnaJ domain-containing protein [Polyangiaceae bacterium]
MTVELIVTNQPLNPRVPRLIPECNLMTLPLTPAEAFLLSRIDGHQTARDLAMMTGIDEAMLMESLDRLAQMGAVTWDGAEPAERKEREKKSDAERVVRSIPSPVVEERVVDPRPEPLPLYDPSELDEPCDLPEDKRRTILDAFYRLEDMDYYELLNVPSTATKKEIKDSYYRLVAEYHPDQYFRKNLGSFKQKMETVFSRLTQAHDTLTRKQSRAEYDSYLSTVQSTRRLEESLRSSRATVDDSSTGEARTRDERVEPSSVLGAGRREMETAPVRRGETEEVKREEMVLQEPLVSGQPMRSSARPAPTRESMRARREAFAARMSGGRVSRIPPPPTPSSEPPARPSVPQGVAAGEALLRHVTERKEAVRQAQIDKYLQAAKTALEQGDFAAAANSYRLALHMEPDSAEIQEAFETTQARATVELAGSYLQQARYEERAERWLEAARSYSRAADGMLSDAQVQSKAAEAMWKANLDLRKAAEYAKRALALDSNNPEYHVILGKIYLAAGLVLNARRELELANELSPNDATIAKLLEAVRKGGKA